MGCSSSWKKSIANLDNKKKAMGRLVYGKKLKNRLIQKISKKNNRQ
jgi:hypothetical protein